MIELNKNELRERLNKKWESEYGETRQKIETNGPWDNRNYLKGRLDAISEFLRDI